MAQVVITRAAAEDVHGILIYLARYGGRQVAAKYDDKFGKVYERLAEHPESGPPRPRLGRHVRIAVVSPYIVAYRCDEARNLVTILRILHGRRRITGRLLSSATPEV